MPLPQQVLHVRNELENHLKKFDWSGLTNGRRNILETFLRLATTEGYAAVTMRSLGKALNVKPPSIYSHFPYGRDEIVAECLRWHYYNFGMAVLDAVSVTESTSEFLNALISVHLTHQLTRPENALWDMLVESDRVGNFLEEDTRKEVHYWIDLCVRLYEAVGHELNNQGDVKEKARMVMALLDSSPFWAQWDGKKERLEYFCSQTLKTAISIFNM